jgi:hypothetical protein
MKFFSRNVDYARAPVFRCYAKFTRKPFCVSFRGMLLVFSG